MPSGNRRTAPTGNQKNKGTGHTPQGSAAPTRVRPSDRPPADSSRPTDAVAPPDGRTRYANGERRRSEIVSAAMEVFAEQGFNNLSLRQIAAAPSLRHQGCPPPGGTDPTGGGRDAEARGSRH